METEVKAYGTVGKAEGKHSLWPKMELEALIGLELILDPTMIRTKLEGSEHMEFVFLASKTFWYDQTRYNNVHCC